MRPRQLSARVWKQLRFPLANPTNPANVTNMSYEDAPSTILLASRCAVCSRSLRDAVSVELGIGPVCRERHGYDYGACTEEERQQANKLVHDCAVHVDDDEFRLIACAELRLLGFAKLATRIEFRGKDEAKRRKAAKNTVVIKEHKLPGIHGGWVKGLLVSAPYNENANYAWRRIGGRKWMREHRANFIPSRCKQSLWHLLKTYYAGCAGTGPRGDFQIQ